MGSQKYLNQFQVKIDGTIMSKDFYTVVQEIVVDTSLGMPGMFSIRIIDDDLTWLDNAQLDFGKSVQIDAIVDAEQSSSGTPVTLITGEITALEPSFSSDGHVSMAIRGYDKTHRLYLARKTKTWLNIKDSDLASQVASGASLSVEADATTVQYPQVFQYNQTDIEFLKARAERIGYQVYGLDGKLYFKKSDNFPASSVNLVFLENLTSFEPRWTLSQQVDTADVKGWDPKQKTAITNTSSPVTTFNQGGMTKGAGSYLSMAIASEKYTIVDQPVISTADAKAVGDGVSNAISREFVQAEGTCVGTPSIKAGCTVNITKIGTRFSGNYFITSATHIWTAAGYETRFSVSGHQPNTLGHLLSDNGSLLQKRGLAEGVVIGIVTNINDSGDGAMGRVKVKYPWLDDTLESNWIRFASPMAGSSRGIMFLPEVNDEVLVAFEHGDFNSPYIIGMLWNGQDAPPLTNADAIADGKVIQRIVKTRVGHTILLNDKSGEEQILIKSKSGHQIILDDKSGSEKVTIKDKTGNNSLVIDSSANSMTVNVKDFKVTATGSVTISATQKIDMSANQNISLAAKQNLALSASIKSELKGAQVSINGTGQAELKSSGILQVQGSLVKIN